MLLVDFDPQGNLTSYLGTEMPDGLEKTITTLMEKVIEDKLIMPSEAVIHSVDGVDYIPANITLSNMENRLVNTLSRETVLRSVLENYEGRYDYCLIDCGPSLGFLLVNALSAANSVIIPVQAQPFALQGMAMLIESIAGVKRHINRQLQIDGVVMTMTDKRTTLSKEVCNSMRIAYGNRLRIFDTEIPRNTKTAESSAAKQSVVLYDPSSPGAKAYLEFTQEVLNIGAKEQILERDSDARDR